MKILNIFIKLDSISQGGQMAIFRAIFGKCGYFWELFSIKKILAIFWFGGYFVAIFQYF